ncbi:MAG TPA: VOC family protein [Casimicrobiaceae bacterium]|jgi:catechol 2,3-dioxygenase-like lactoylglutathione lyase family enzyme|nr:VOC family protein [Casimicrobiaceae bacterium]
MRIDRLDHLVLTVRDLRATIDFYTRVLGMEEVTFAGARKALAFGRQKLNLHVAGAEFQPHARTPVPGSADLCFITDTPLDDAMAHVRACGVAIEEGPLPKTGATSALRSFYVRDPDGNLVEISNLVQPLA